VHEKRGIEAEMNLTSALQSEKTLVDVAGIEPATPCLQSWEGKTLNALTGVAYTESQLDFRSLKCPEVVPNIGALNVERAVCRLLSLSL